MGCLLHAHLDHIGILHYVRKDIPIYSSAITLAIAKASEDTGAASPMTTAMPRTIRNAKPANSSIRRARRTLPEPGRGSSPARQRGALYKTSGI